VNEESARLEGFEWRLEEKPTMEDINLWRTVDEIDMNAKNLFNQPDEKLTPPTDQEIQKSLDERSTIDKKRILKPLLPIKKAG
jgi:hypothetical protein